MSVQMPSSDLVRRVMPQYAPGTGVDRYVRFCEEIIGLQLGDTQSRLLEALEQHRRVVAVGGNGVGKSYGVGGAGSIASLYCNRDCTVNITSGSYGQLDDTIWKPIKSIHRDSALPGRTLDNKRELKSGLDEEWYLKCLSPKYPADLEGRHNRRMIYIIEEADKPGITKEHIDSAESTLTDSGDRLFVIANPPTDDANVVADLIESPKWETVQFSSFDCHNVQVDIGQQSGEKIPGLVDLSEIRENWEDWNKREWPGYETAFTAHHDDDSLDTRWYRRRVGIQPPQDATIWRPLDLNDVREAFERPIGHNDTRETPSAVGIDVARSGDKTVMVGVHNSELRVHYAERGDDHTVQKQALRQLIEEWPRPSIVVDAVGEGSGLADDLNVWFPDVTRFSNGSVADDATTYATKWAEGLDHLGQFLEDGSYADKSLREELMVSAGIVTFSERHLSSRGANGATVIEATTKEDIDEELDHSPDYLDAALMAVWAAAETARDNQRLTW